MVEFMLVLPLLVVLLYGIIEVSRLVFIFASVNASQAARYGAVAGEIQNGYYYQDCDGIGDIVQTDQQLLLTLMKSTLHMTAVSHLMAHRSKFPI